MKSRVVQVNLCVFVSGKFIQRKGTDDGTSWKRTHHLRGDGHGLQIVGRSLVGACLVLIWSAVAGCGSRGDRGTPLESGRVAPILLFNGTGASHNDVAAVETILTSNGLDYSTVNSSQLNTMGEAEIGKHRLLIIPGGNFIDIGNGLTSSTGATVRNAVQHGLNYLGICAGAFLAGDTIPNGLNLTSGVRFGFYAAEDRGIRKAAVAITIPGAATLDQYWEDGPQLAGWGTVVGTYPDGTPAVTEGRVGRGWVLLTGIHAEAPETWRHGMTFSTSVSDDNAYAVTLVRAALSGTPLSGR